MITKRQAKKALARLAGKAMQFVLMCLFYAIFMLPLMFWGFSKITTI